MSGARQHDSSSRSAKVVSRRVSRNCAAARFQTRCTVQMGLLAQDSGRATQSFSEISPIIASITASSVISSG